MWIKDLREPKADYSFALEKEREAESVLGSLSGCRSQIRPDE